jgi:GT2 family glycosyltransferase
MKLSIIIVTYKSNDIIKECLSSIYQHIKLGNDEYEVIVVDNSSDSYKENLKKIIEKSPIEKIRFISSDENLGYGAGNNIGLRVANGKIACIMNPDIRLVEPLFEYALSCFSLNENLALMGCKQIGGANLSYYLRPEKNLSFLNPLVIKIFNILNIYNNRYFYLSGALMFIDIKKFKEIDLFDEEIFLYFEEPDISNRFLSKGYDIRFCKAKKYCHRVLLNERNNWNPYLFDNLFKSVKYYHNKYNFNFGKYLIKNIIWYNINYLILKITNSNYQLAKAKLKRYKQLIQASLKEVENNFYRYLLRRIS